MPGSHGSTTKAGRVKSLTPKVKRKGVNSHPKKIPRVRYREKYEKLFIKEGYNGQPLSQGAVRERNKKRDQKRMKKKKY